MKSRGIIRRLDELGRVVIPREFRKMYRINVGDPLEISAADNGDIIVSRVDNLPDLVRQSQIACEILHSEVNATICVSTFDRFVVAEGAAKGGFVDKDLPIAVTRLLKNRNKYNGLITSEEVGKMDYPFSYVVIEPIQSLDDCFGGIFAFSNEPLTDKELGGLKIASRLIGDNLSKY